jgi:type II secretion system protein C
MKQQTWILNSSLLIIFGILLFANILLKQELPKVRLKTELLEEIEKKKLSYPVEIERIYTNDIFDTFAFPTKIPAKQSLITQIPEPQAPSVTPPPEIKKVEFIDPLNISLKGIILSSDDINSVAMIADETNKEGIYHLGDRIKDGQIIKISRNKVVVLRANGQQEILLLRKVEIPQEIPASKWEYAIKKIDDTTYEVDPTEFTKEIQSLGSLIENLSLGTAYKNGNAIGIKLGKMYAASFGPSLGLNESDIISVINDINTSEIKDRIKIYDAISEMKHGDTIKLVLNRNGSDLTFNYKLARIPKPSKKSFIQPAAEGAPQVTPAELFKPNEEQRREEIQRHFKNMHYSPNQQNVIQDIRNRLKENLRMRSMNRRVRY